jgi:hypothetical protein
MRKKNFFPFMAREFHGGALGPALLTPLSSITWRKIANNHKQNIF